jgi:two-component system OmpR family sensor kinase
VSGIAFTMKRWDRFPLRVRLTLAFTAGMALVLAGVGVFVYMRSGADLLDTTEAGLRSRAEILSADIAAHGPSLANVRPTLIERDEAFAQIADESGKIVESSSIVRRHPLLDASVTRTIDQPAFFDRRIPGIDNLTRVLAVPVESSGETFVVMVGSSLQDRRDQLLQLAATLAIGGPIALALISLAGWTLAGAALRPVERMRREVDQISAENLGGRLTTTPADDEISRLGATLNAMLDRIDASFQRERRFVDDASHELRTPLSILRAELDLALSRPRTLPEAEAALRAASEETEHLVRLAEDLLVLSRAQEGRLPVHRSETSISSLLDGVASHFEPRASTSSVRIEVSAPEVNAHVDPVRVRQALDDMLDNALRHTPSGGLIRLVGERVDGEVLVSVEDTGGGFAPEVLERAFLPFARGPGVDGTDGAGLGLAIVRAIAEAHGGGATARNRVGGGATVTLTIRDPV